MSTDLSVRSVHTHQGFTWLTSSFFGIWVTEHRIHKIFIISCKSYVDLSIIDSLHSMKVQRTRYFIHRTHGFPFLNFNDSLRVTINRPLRMVPKNTPNYSVQCDVTYLQLLTEDALEFITWVSRLPKVASKLSDFVRSNKKEQLHV